MTSILPASGERGLQVECVGVSLVKESDRGTLVVPVCLREHKYRGVSWIVNSCPLSKGAKSARDETKE